MRRRLYALSIATAVAFAAGLLPSTHAQAGVSDGGTSLKPQACNPVPPSSVGSVTGNTHVVIVDIHTPPLPPCPALGSGRVPAYGDPVSAPPPSAGTPCPDGPNGPEAYDPAHPHYVTTPRVPIALDMPADPTRDPEEQPRQPLASVPAYFINTGPHQPPTIPGVDGQSPITERSTSTLADLEYHPGFTRYTYAVDSGQADGQGHCKVALSFDPVKPDKNIALRVCCGIVPGQQTPGPAALLQQALDLEKTWAPGTVSVTPADSFVVFVPTCLWTNGGTVPSTSQAIEYDVARPDDPATGRHVFLQYLIILTPGRLHIDWGDGFSDDIDAAAARSGPPQNPPADCTIRHDYKQVSGEAHGGPPGGLTIRVTQEVTIRATVTTFDGVDTVTSTVILPQQPPALDYTPDPQPRHLVQQIEAVVR
jgi:hypothetical protein